MSKPISKRLRIDLETYPACWYMPAADFATWDPGPITAFDDLTEEHARRLREDPVIIEIHRGPDAFLRAWQNGRCALCGRRDQPLVEDHDHVTGYTRGMLCHSCNTREGFGTMGPFQRYRELHPTMILGLRIRYFDSRNRRFAERVPAQCVTWRAMGGAWRPADNALIGIGL